MVDYLDSYQMAVFPLLLICCVAVQILQPNLGNPNFLQAPTRLPIQLNIRPVLKISEKKNHIKRAKRKKIEII